MTRSGLQLMLEVVVFGLAALWSEGREATAFVNVNVVPMDSERILERQTVIVRDGRIVAMGATDNLDVPEDAVRIDGGGSYLMPGLVDMHVHLYTPQEFPLYLANGVTTVYNLWGRPAHLIWRDRTKRGEMLGPNIYTCGPIIFRTETGAEARTIVEEQSKAGYDSIKIYNDVSKEAYPILVEAARAKKMLVVGHIPRMVGLDEVLKARQAIAHAEEYVYTVFDWNVEDASKIPPVVAATREAGVPVTLTIVFYDHMIQQAADLPSFLAGKELKYLAPWARVLWGPGLNRYNPMNSSPASLRFLNKSLAFQKMLSRELHQAGVKVLAGTDAMTPGAVPGFSLHEELQNMAELGMTPFEVIRAATRYPAEFLSPGGEFGTVAVGQRADLILVEGNPLADLANVKRRAGVMVCGVWRTEAQLQTMLEEVPASYVQAGQHVRSLLERDPAQASRYLIENDPFDYLALAVLVDLVAEQGMDVFKKLYRDSRRERPGADLFAEINMTALGHRLLELGRTRDGIELLEINQADHEKSGKAREVLADAYLKGGNKEKAIVFYRKALETDPSLKHSIEALRTLGEIPP